MRVMVVILEVGDVFLVGGLLMEVEYELPEVELTPYIHNSPMKSSFGDWHCHLAMTYLDVILNTPRVSFDGSISIWVILERGDMEDSSMLWTLDFSCF